MKEIHRLKAVIRLIMDAMKKHPCTRETEIDLRYLQQKLRRLQQQMNIK